MNSSETAAHVLIQGRVQGVGYRYFALEAANARGLKGWVRNLPNGHVECQVEGPRLAVELFIEDLRKGPSFSRVDDVRVDGYPPTGQFSTFEIRG